MKRLLIECGGENILTALTNGGRLVELFADPRGGDSWVGRVIVGRLKTILPGQFAFVDIGAKKNAFVNLRKGHGLKAGQPLLVQVEKDASGTKGMCVGLEISLKGRLIVLCAGHSPTVGVSRKIDDEREARRLKKIVRKNLPAGYGAIIRTNAAGQTAEAIAEEIAHLNSTHAEIIARAEFALPPATLFPTAAPQTISKNLLSDILSEELDEIRINGEEFEEIKRAVCEILPALESKISREPFSLKKQIAAALSKETRLPCGGFITIEQTEACVVIDVNTGSNVGKTDYRATVLETNLEAAAELAAQIRARNLSGIILVDFIDMPAESDKALLLEALAAEIKKDRVRTEIAGFVGLGMVQLTRRRTRPPIAEILQKKCPHCGSAV